MAGLTTSNFSAALKTIYPANVLKALVYENNPFLAAVPKSTKAGGDGIKVPVIYANPQGRSATLSTAITNKGNTGSKAFTLTRASDYSVASIAREVMLATQGDEMAFARAVKVEIDGAFNTAVRSAAKALYGAGSGKLGRISSSSNVASSSITLSDINDITNFEVGMQIVLSDTETGGSLRSSGANALITGIDRNAGTLSFAGNLSAEIAAAAASDYIYQDGDYDAMMKGLAAWIPSSAPGATSFFGVDRTADVTRLGGVRHTGAGQTVEEALIDLARKVAREGGKPDVCFLNPVQLGNLIKSLGSKATLPMTTLKAFDAPIGFEGVQLYTPVGMVKVIGDFNCPATRAYMLQMNTWKLYSLDEVPHIFDLDNDQKLLREATADNYEVRVGYYAQLGCSAPGWNGVATLDSAT